MAKCAPSLNLRLNIVKKSFLKGGVQGSHIVCVEKEDLKSRLASYSHFNTVTSTVRKVSRHPMSISYRSDARKVNGANRRVQVNLLILN